MSEDLSFYSEFVLVFETEVFKVECFAFFVMPIFQSILVVNGLKPVIKERKYIDVFPIWYFFFG